MFKPVTGNCEHSTGMKNTNNRLTDVSLPCLGVKYISLYIKYSSIQSSECEVTGCKFTCIFFKYGLSDKSRNYFNGCILEILSKRNGVHVWSIDSQQNKKLEITKRQKYSNEMRLYAMNFKRATGRMDGNWINKSMVST